MVVRTEQEIWQEWERLATLAACETPSVQRETAREVIVAVTWLLGEHNYKPMDSILGKEWAEVFMKDGWDGLVKRGFAGWVSTSLPQLLSAVRGEMRT